MTRVKIDENMFWTVKTLTKGGATIPEISDFLKISTSTVSRIRASESLQEYKNQLAAIALEIKARNQAKKASEKKHEENIPAPVTAPEKAPEKPAKDVQEKQDRTQYNYVNNRVLEELKAQNELLKLISNKLCFIVEQLM